MSGDQAAVEAKKASPLDSISHAWRALRSRNFQLYFAGQGLSLIGTWMTRLAGTWLVYHLTHSALMLGVVSFCGQITTFVMGPFAGVWIERMERRRMLIWTQMLLALQSLALAVLTLTGRITLGELIALTVLGGVVNAFDLPGRQAFLVQMVDDKRDLSNAIAISASMNNGGRLIGPAIAGVVVATLGEGWCFAIDAVSFLAVIVSLVLMRVHPVAAKPGKGGMRGQIREGWEYVSGFRPVRTILMLFALLSLMGFPCMVLMPVFAGQVLHGGPATLGWLMGATGVGALASGLSLTTRKGAVGPGTVLVSAAVFSVTLVGFGFSRTLWMSMVLMVVVGFGMMQSASASNTIIQTLVPEDKRARVISYYAMAYFGAAPFGSLLAGGLAHWVGVQRTVMLTGAFCVAVTAWFSTQIKQVRAEMRPIYEEMGLLPTILDEAEPAA